jgi:peroxiredoxin Q/BCP
VFGVSVDSKEEIASFVEENALNFPLLSDSDKTVVERYGVLNNVGLANRITFIIDKSGHITYILREVDIETHADLVLDMAKKLI